MRSHEIALAALMLCAAMGAVRADPLLLEVWRNGVPTETVVPVTRAQDALLIPSADFPALGLNVTAPPGEQVDLGRLPGISATLDETGQRLLLTVAPASLPRQLYDLGAGAAPSSTPGEAGAILRYDFSVTLGAGAQSRLSGGAGLGLDIFRDQSRFTANGFGTFGGRSRVVRLDTALVFERPGRLTRMTVGDAITVTPASIRAVRFAGLQYATDFSLAPGLVTMPLPSFFGTSEVPATVEVFGGAAKLAQQDIAPGPFELRNLPVLTGGGAATVVVRDMLGRETTQSFSLFLDQAMLAPGRDAFAFGLGFRRAGYGLRSFDYRDPMLSARWRRLPGWFHAFGAWRGRAAPRPAGGRRRAGAWAGFCRRRFFRQRQRRGHGADGGAVGALQPGADQPVRRGTGRQ